MIPGLQSDVKSSSSSFSFLRFSVFFPAIFVCLGKLAMKNKHRSVNSSTHNSMAFTSALKLRIAWPWEDVALLESCGKTHVRTYLYYIYAYVAYIVHINITMHTKT